MSTRRRCTRTGWCATAAVALAVAADPATAQGRSRRNLPPLVIAEQGSFFVNGQIKQTRYAAPTPATEPGEITIKQMYVQYQRPADARSAIPVILVHGGTHTGVTYETTPDGREGWATYFVRQGFPTYVVDMPGRGRSGFDRSVINQARAENNLALLPGIGLSSNTVAWTGFRIGPSYGVPFANTQFPVRAAAQYFAQLNPSAETTLDEPHDVLVTEAMSALLDRIGPSVIAGHSRGGQPMLNTALARPSLVRGVIAVEPVSCTVSDAEIAVIRHIPYLVVFGDNLDAAWSARLQECRQTAARFNAAGGNARVIHLPELGVVGNSHLISLDRNNLEVADLLIAWTRLNVPQPPRRR